MKLKWLPNFMKKWACKTHLPFVRYDGMTVIGYECRECGYKWYESRFSK